MKSKAVSLFLVFSLFLTGCSAFTTLDDSIKKPREIVTIDSLVAENAKDIVVPAEVGLFRSLDSANSLVKDMREKGYELYQTTQIDDRLALHFKKTQEN